VMAWPFNGTRRWYLAHRMRHADAGDYLTTVARRQAELHRLVFAHGIEVLVVPLFGSQLLERGEEYTRYALGGLKLIRDDAVYRDMYTQGLRVQFYGDYVEKLRDPFYASVLDVCAELAAATASGSGPLLLLGLFADDAHPTLARMSVEFGEKHGRPPNRAELIEAYYGLPVPDLGLYVGFAQHALFDVPLLANGLEDLYATLNPSPDLSERQLREILYDHLVTRRAPELDYRDLSPEAQAELAAYGQRCADLTLGLGRIHPLTRTWTPLVPQDPA
jgi:hypothetical protein